MSKKDARNGWIKVDRDISEHWIYSERPVGRFQAWIDLILSANFRDKTILLNGHPFTIRRGSFLTSTRKLAERWGWGKDKVSRFLAILRREGMIRTETPGGTLLTIVNYSLYQVGRDTKSDSHKDTDKDTDKDTHPIQLKKEEEGRRKKRKEPESNRAEDDDDDGMSAEEYAKWREAQQNGTV